MLARFTLGTDDLAPRVHARTDGNAFFVEEVLRGLAEPGPPVVPESVRHAVGVRLSRMGDDANELIAAAAILGLEHDAARVAGHRRARARRRRGGPRRDPACPAPAARDDRHTASSLRTRLFARRCSTSATSCAAPGFTAAPRSARPTWARTGTSRKSRCTCSRPRRPATLDGQPRCSPRRSPRARPARVRGRGRTLRARARGARPGRRRGRVRPAAPRSR